MHKIVGLLAALSIGFAGAALAADKPIARA
jgi:hypothetical protein